jgi:hypothetical protein
VILGFYPDLFLNLSNLELALNKDENQDNGKDKQEENGGCGHVGHLA